jgi:hypothetical protein
MHNENLTVAQLATLMRDYTADVEAAWADQPAPVPSPERQPLASAVAAGITITEPQYAAALRFLLEDGGHPNARAAVLGNRFAINNGLDLGSEPDDVARAVIAAGA